MSRSVGSYWMLGAMYGWRQDYAEVVTAFLLPTLAAVNPWSGNIPARSPQGALSGLGDTLR